MFRKKEIVVAIALATASTITAPAFGEIEEVIVTATKRSESTQDIPVAVSAVSQQALEDFGIAN
ncbi:MAG: iron complex outermembrane receptor protein, partial [Candidatus Azotimanducaceae bacterium]